MLPCTSSTTAWPRTVSRSSTTSASPPSRSRSASRDQTATSSRSTSAWPRISRGTPAAGCNRGGLAIRCSNPSVHARRKSSSKRCLASDCPTTSAKARCSSFAATPTTMASASRRAERGCTTMPGKSRTSAARPARRRAREKRRAPPVGARPPRGRRQPLHLPPRPGRLRGRVLRRPDQDLRRGQLPAWEVGDVRLPVRQPMGPGDSRPRVLRRRRQAFREEDQCEEVRPWSLVSYRGREGESRAGALDGDRVVELPVKASGVLELVERWDRVEPALREFDPGGARAVDWAELELPLHYPRKVLCSGTNYYAH